MISMDKKYRTRDGCEVRIYALDGGGLLTVHGAFMKSDNSHWVQMTWKKNGEAANHDSPLDLVEIKPRAIDRMIEWLRQQADENMTGMRHTPISQAYSDAMVRAKMFRDEEDANK